MIESDSKVTKPSHVSHSAMCGRFPVAATAVLIVISIVFFLDCDKSRMATKSTDFFSSSAVRSGVEAPVLLFTGDGTSPNDVAAVTNILSAYHIDYSTADSFQLNRMSESQMRGFRLLIVPGGNFIAMGKSLTAGTAANIRDAVQHGMNYLGICAGGFLAGDSAYYNGLNLTSGVRFGFYAAENQGIRKAALPIARPGAPALDQYWEDGPQFTGWGAVVARYPDGTPAIVQGTFGSGWVILSGVHPEAPESWRRGMTFSTLTREDNAYAGMLIQAALNRTALPHY